MTSLASENTTSLVKAMLLHHISSVSLKTALFTPLNPIDHNKNHLEIGCIRLKHLFFKGCLEKTSTNQRQYKRVNAAFESHTGRCQLKIRCLFGLKPRSRFLPLPCVLCRLFKRTFILFLSSQHHEFPPVYLIQVSLG